MNDGMQPGLDIKKPLLELRQELASLYQDRLADFILYGSWARGDAETDSDIDVLVVLKGQTNPVSEIHRTSGIVSGISLKYDVVISCVFIEETKYASDKGPLVRNIRREGIRI